MSLAKDTKAKIMKDFGINATDTGSAPVQIALLTEKIKSLTEHLNTNKKDYSTKRGLLNAVARRRKLLTYLHDTDEAQYRKTIERLGLKK